MAPRRLAPALLVAVSLLAVAIALPRASRADRSDRAPAASNTIPSASASALTPGSTGTVLHIGDSFVDAGLQQALRPMFATAGARYYSHGRVRAWLSTWSDQPGLEEMLGRYRPALILVTLGANEMVDRRPEGRAVLVRRLVKRFHGTPCVWIGHPVWKGVGPGLMEVVRRSCSPCRYYDSLPISDSIKRQPDGIHPDKDGGAFWAKEVFDWLQQERDASSGPWGMKTAPAGEHGEESDGGAEGPESGIQGGK